MRIGASNFRDAIDSFIGSFDHEVEEFHFMQNAERPALLTCSVVGHDYEDGVVQLPERIEFIDQAANLRVGMFEERTECFLQCKCEFLLVLGERVPRFNTRVTRCQLGVSGNQTEFNLLCEPSLARNIPAFVVLATMASEILIGRLMRSMGGAKSEIGEEGAIWSNRDGVVNELDRFVDQIFTEVISLGRSRWRIDSVIVVNEIRRELIGFAIEESVEPIETALQWPCVVGTGSGGFVHGTQVPLPERKGCVANLTQNLAHRGCILRNAAGHVRIARVEVCDTAHSDGVVVATCQ